MPLYEVGIYNQTVRNYVRSGENIPDHINVSKDFECVMYFEREARNIQVLDSKISKEFPKNIGYVVDYVRKVQE